MKVVCIEGSVNLESSKIPTLVKGNIYHVVEERSVCDYVSPVNARRAINGIYYNLIETGYWYHSSLFVKINDTEIDEMELVNRNELVNR